MKKIILTLLLSILSFNIINSILISHTNDDIRQSILESFKDKPKKELFKVYHFLYNKQYDLNSEEGIRRYKIFKSTLKDIELINSKNLSYKLGINKFSDLSNQEFSEIYAKPIPIHETDSYIQRFLKSERQINFDEAADADEEKLSKEFKNPNLNQQTKINWVNSMNPPSDQGVCGSCWIFSTIATIEGNYNIKFGNSPSFSQQEIVDCRPDNKGCSGGFPYNALDYIKSNGIAYLNAYPYLSGITKTPGECQSGITTRNMIVESYEHCQYMRCPSSQYFSMLQNGPLTVFIDADAESESAKLFKSYKGGILENMPCKSTTHAVALIGTDFDEKGQYLISRNSWGPDWGENGNFRIRRSQSGYTCFMESFAVLPKVAQTFNPVPPTPAPACLKLYKDQALKGDVLEICQNTPSIRNFPNVNSFHIGKFKSVRIYHTVENCLGGYYTLNKSYASFTAENGLGKLINNIKSVIVEDITPPNGCIWAYDYDCLSGDKIEICNDVPDLKVLNFADKISSFRLGQGIKGITIYLKPNYGGSYAVLNGDYYGMFGLWMNNAIESLKLVK